MVLRRPYAFLIKHFRLIHLIITAILTFLVIKLRGVYKFLNSVIEVSTNRYGASEYINYGLIIIIFVVLLLFLAIYWLLKYKDKPRRLYMFAIGGYIVISIFLLILFSFIASFEYNVVDAKTIRFYRDTLLIMMVFQYVFILLMAVRGFGFDIKKFDFNKDAAELNATESDSEEIEINTQIDTTNIVRGIEKGKRELGYYVKEYRPYVIVIGVVIVAIIGINAYKFINNNLKTYHEGDIVGEKNILKINEGYYGIYDDGEYVIINFDAYKYGKKERLNINNLALHIGKKTYIPNKNICSQFSSFGTCYKKQFITEEARSYIATYEVDDLNIKKTYLTYTDSFDKTYKIKIKFKEA